MSTPDGFDGQILPVSGTDDSRAVEPNDVVFQGQIIGSDPDANVRLQILKQAEAAGAGGN